jgi:hypothetical protein
MILIDATPIKKFIEDGLNCKDPLKAFGHDAIEILTEIEFAPAVDAVEVVRCKDCRCCEQIGYVFFCHHWDRNTDENGYCHEGY